MEIKTELPNNPNWLYNNVPQYIILHHAEASTCIIQDINNWHLSNGWNGGCGYHYLVRKDGTIYRGRPETAVGAHCPSYNRNSIGICAEGDYSKETMPDIQKQSIIELGRYLRDKYSIQVVYGHGEVYATECPGANYPLDEVKNYILNNEPVQENFHAFVKEAIVKAQVLVLELLENNTFRVLKTFKAGDNITVVNEVTKENIDYFIIDIDNKPYYVAMGNIDLKE